MAKYRVRFDRPRPQKTEPSIQEQPTPLEDLPFAEFVHTLLRTGYGQYSKLRARG